MTEAEYLATLPPRQRCASRRPAPCRRCGGFKEVGRGRGVVLCIACEEEAAHLCRRCGERPRVDRYVLCRECKWPCPDCGGVRPLGKRRCEECASERRELNRRRAAARWATRGRKRCAGCGRSKGPGRRRRYCDRCIRERELPAMCGCGRERLPTRAAKLCLTCRAESATRRRRAKAEWDRKRREAMQAGTWQPDPVASEKGRASARKRWRQKPEPLPGYLPAAPLAAIVDRLAEEADGGGAKLVCEAAGVNDRRLREWRKPDASVRFDTAERTLIRLGLDWDEVWADHDELLAAVA